MAHGVFIHRTDSIYRDMPAVHYQFPRQYLGRVEACVGSWIIYYEPRKALESRGYFAMAVVQQVTPDPEAQGMYLALMKPGSYLEFPEGVPFRDEAGLVEKGVLNEDGRISGRAQAAVRPLSTSDFNRIIDRGLGEDQPLLPRVDDLDLGGVSEREQASFAFEQSRDRVSYLTSRIMRDRAFRRIVLRAYGERCAVTGLKLINGGGRAEVAAAHIRPVEADGPDIISNGIALSGTAHWMFDRGLIGLADDLKILVSRQANDRDGIEAIINKSGYALAPQRTFERPHPLFLGWHREHCFKQ
jgi:putative restriction endonuclease